VIVRLAHKGVIDKLLIDTCHFKGNYPDSCLVEGCVVDGDDSNANFWEAKWTAILPQSKLQADHEHEFTSETKEVFTHVRLTIFPDGGISRMRCWGRIVK
jgi:allantoicase